MLMIGAVIGRMVGLATVDLAQGMGKRWSVGECVGGEEGKRHDQVYSAGGYGLHLQRRGVRPPFFIIALRRPPPPLASSPSASDPPSLILPPSAETFGPWTWIDPGAFALVSEGGGGRARWRGGREGKGWSGEG